MRGKKLFFSVAMCIAVMALFTACGKTEIDVSQFVKVSFDGLDGEGIALLTTDGLNSAIENVILGEDGSLEDAFLKYDQLSSVEDAVTVELDKENELSNGDTVTVNITVDNDTAKEYGIKFVGTDSMNFTVSDLQEITEIDPFAKDVFNVTNGEGIYIDFTGISPNARVQIRNTLPQTNPLSEVTYTAEGNYNNVKKGQDVTITASAPYEWKEKGYVLTSEQATVKCEKVDEYITSLDDIDDATWEKIKKQCDDLKKSKIDAKVSYSIYYKNADGDRKGIDDIDSTGNYKYSKDYLLSLKDGLESGYFFNSNNITNNGLFISYTIDLKGVPKDYFGKETYDVKNACGYFVIPDLVKDKNGDILFTADKVSIGGYIYTDEDTMKISELNQYFDKFELSESDSNLKK